MFDAPFHQRPRGLCTIVVDSVTLRRNFHRIWIQTSRHEYQCHEHLLRGKLFERRVPKTSNEYGQHAASQLQCT